jgi:hypothetical protein
MAWQGRPRCASELIARRLPRREGGVLHGAVAQVMDKTGMLANT